MKISTIFAEYLCFIYLTFMPLPKYNFEGRLILIAEDTYINYLLLEEILSRAGATILWAKTGSEAIDLFINNKPDVVLLDIQLEQEDDGFEIKNKMREVKGKEEIKIIAQTALAMHDEHQRITQAGFDGYIAKPINKTQLLDMLADIFADKH